MLRLILSCATETPRDISTYQLVCKRWYGIYDNRYWKELYTRDYKPELKLSDLANYQIVYKNKWLSLDSCSYGNFIKVDKLLPENLVFGLQVIPGLINIVPYYIDHNFGVQYPILLKLNGFQLKFKIPHTRYITRRDILFEVLKFNNTSWDRVLNNLNQYIVKNKDTIIGHRKNNIFTYLSRQYSYPGDVVYSKALSTIEKGSEPQFTIDTNQMWDCKGNSIKRIRLNCEGCKEWHDYTNYGFYNFCKKNKGPECTFDNSIFVIKLDGFTINHERIMKPHIQILEIWFSN